VRAAAGARRFRATYARKHLRISCHLASFDRASCGCWDSPRRR